MSTWNFMLLEQVVITCNSFCAYLLCILELDPRSCILYINFFDAGYIGRNIYFSYLYRVTYSLLKCHVHLAVTVKAQGRTHFCCRLGI